MGVPWVRRGCACASAADYLGIPWPEPILNGSGNWANGANSATGGAGILPPLTLMCECNNRSVSALNLSVQCTGLSASAITSVCSAITSV